MVLKRRYDNNSKKNEFITVKKDENSVLDSAKIANDMKELKNIWTRGKNILVYLQFLSKKI